MRYLIVIGCAVLLDWLLGDPYWLPHPIRWIGGWIQYAERMVTKLPCPRRLQGVVLWVSVVAVTWGVTWLLLRVLWLIHPWAAFAGEVILLYTSLAARCLQQEAQKILRELETGNLEQARHWLAYIVGRETADLPAPEVIRAVVETVAENTVDGIISPLFYAFIGGAPLALAYKAVNTLDSMVGYENDRYRELGWASARLDDVANWIPARFAAILIPLVAYLYNGRLVSSWKIMLRDRKCHASPNSGHPEAAVAGALQVQLGGASRYFGKVVEKPVIGDPVRPLEPDMIRDTIALMYGTEILAFLCLAIARIHL